MEPTEVRSSPNGTTIVVKADLYTPLVPLLDELGISPKRRDMLLDKLALRNYNRGNFILRDVLRYAADSL